MASLIRSELETLLAQAPKLAQEHARVCRERFGGARDVVLFGAKGFLADHTLAGLRKQGRQPVAFADNRRELWGQTVEGIDVLSPAEAASRHGDSAVFVVTIFNGSAVRRQLEELGVRDVAHFAAFYMAFEEGFLPFNAVEDPRTLAPAAPDVLAAFDLLADDDSRREYLAQVRFMLGETSAMPAPLPAAETYFQPDLVGELRREVFVDCGAADGDTIAELLARSPEAFSRLYAVEPDPGNRRKLLDRVAKLPEETAKRIQLLNYGLGNERKTLRFRATAKADAHVDSGGEIEVSIAPLDELLEGAAPTFIKMDIEGAEYGALQGASQLIRAHIPLLAVCLYHVREDLWRIPLLVNRLSGSYRLYLRRYAEDCWETVLYAIPEDRPKA